LISPDGENIILEMETAVSPAFDGSVADRTVERALSARHSAYAEEVRRLIDAGVAVMRRGQSTDPRVSEIVSEAGLSNQAFYRHFRSKDELLLAILDDGLRQLVGYLKHQMSKETSGLGKVRRWTEGILAQAVDPTAAEATRGVTINAARLGKLFPEEFRRTEELIEAPVRAAIEAAVDQSELAAADPDRDAAAAYRLVMGTMQSHLTNDTRPSKADVEHLVRFVIGGIGGRH
jgi:AcrR family transcriptional regulator